MTKQTKMLVGVGLLGVAAYLLWKSSQPKVTANASGRKIFKGGKGGVRDIFMPKPGGVRGGSMVVNPRGSGNSGAYGGGLSPSAYGGEGIPTCPNCNKSGKCVERKIQPDGTSLGVVVNCVNSSGVGAYGG